MALSAGTAFVDMQPSLGAGFFGKLQAGLASKLSPVGLAAGGVIAGGIAAGIGLAKVGAEFDKAFDTIRLGTGATGDQLVALGDSFKTVFGAVPTTMDAAANAVADLNTRLGITGDPLEELAQRELELARLTDSDVQPLIASTTRLFGDWSIATEDQADTLDLLWRASQSTGAGVDQLSRQVVQFGAPLRQMGFSLDESLSLLGKFEKEGVNTELVMGSLRIALGNMARAGEEPIDTFGRLVDEIQNSGSTAEANALAMDVFGARAGPDMAAAIREGRFELGELYDQITNGSDTILGAASDTESLGEKWTKFKNQALVAIEPLARRLFDGLGRLFDFLAPKLTAFAAFFEEKIVPAIQTAWSFLEPIFSTIGAVISAIFGGASDDADGFGGSMGELGSTVSDIGATLGTVFQTFGAIIGQVVEIVQAVLDGLRAFWRTWGDQIMGYVRAVWTTISGIIRGAMAVIKGILDVVLGLIHGDWSRVWNGIKGIVSGIWTAIKGIVSGAVIYIRDFLLSILGKIVGGIVSWGAGLVSAAARAIGRMVSAILDAVKALPGEFLKLGGELMKSLAKGIGNLVTAPVNAIKKLGGGLVGGVKKIFGFGSPSRVFVAFGEGLSDSLALGIDRGSSAATKAAGALAGDVSGSAQRALDLATDPTRFAGALSRPAVPATAAATALEPAVAGAGGGGPLVGGDVVIQYPEKELASVAVPRELRKLAYQLGGR